MAPILGQLAFDPLQAADQYRHIAMAAGGLNGDIGNY
jgi:hypothetical protein